MGWGCAMNRAWGRRRMSMKPCAVIARRRGWGAMRRGFGWSSAGLLRRMLLQIRQCFLKRQNHKTRDQRGVFFHPFFLAAATAVGFLQCLELVDQLDAPVVFVALGVDDGRLVVG